MKHIVRSILAKPETTYGVDSVPTAALNAMLVRDLSITPVSTNYDTRNNVKGFLGNDQQIVANYHAMLEFTVEMAPSDALGVVPPWGALLRGCGIAETVVATTSVTYAPISANEESLTVHFRQETDLFKMVGCKGSFSIEASAGKSPLLKFKLEGLVTQAGAISTLAAAAPVYTLWKKPLAVNKDNTQFTIGGYLATMESFSMDVANETPYVNRPNSERVDFTGRKAAGKLQIEKPLLSVKEFYTDIKAANLLALSLTHGTAPGSRFTFSSSKVQITSPTDSESNNVTMLDLTTIFVPNLGNDEFSLLLN